jgi:hypothetical protein
LNGLYVTAELALRTIEDPLCRRYREALILGSLREDVWYLPGVGRVIEHFSFSHFYQPGKPGGFIPYLWPGPKTKADLFYRRGVEAFRAGERASGFVQLGRVAHLLSDMSCPVHAHRSAHLTDPFEWWVEGNAAKLLELPVPHVADAARPSDLIESMATFTQGFAADDTNHPVGGLMKRLGLRESVSAKLAGEQARALIPMAAGHTAALIRLFLREVACSPSPTSV